MYRSVLSQDLFSELDRLQRFAARAFDISPSIRGLSGYRFPAINVSTSPQAVEIDCFAAGIDPKKIELKLEQGVLSISGERNNESTGANQEANVHIEERFA